MTNKIPNGVWKQIVEHSPLVSVDLIIEHDGGILLGRRENEPVRGQWFTPGGVVRKGESLNEAIDRVACGEIGCQVTVHAKLGVYEHFYDCSEFENVSKHYIPIAYVVEPEKEMPVTDSQHSSFEVFAPPYSGFHEYVQTYLDDYTSWKSHQ